MNKINDLVSRETEEPAKAVISKPWAIVEDPGQDSEWVRANFATYKEAFRTFKNWYDIDNMAEGTADIMKREADGTLTTEF
ncbi:MAG: hypothetical protein RLZZ298_3027 [Pseudomonadota bacterium]|jgi:hypothetical protein